MNFSADILKNDEKAIFRLRSLYSSWGYQPYKMSKFEEYDLYVRNKSFLVSDNIITFTDTDGKLMALKPDVTLSIIKNTRDGETRRLYYNENVYRVSEGSHSYKEIMQTGLECIGNIDTYSLCEVLCLAGKSLEMISPDFVLDISHLGIVSTLISISGVSEKGKRRLIECIGEKNMHEIDAICREEGVSPFNCDRLKKLVQLYGKPSSVLPKLRSLLVEEEFEEDLFEFETILSSLSLKEVNLDFSVVGDMTYYNGIVFKGFINTIPSAVLSGGQYDALMKRFGRTSGAVGFAVYLDMLDSFVTAPEYDFDTVLLYQKGTQPHDVLSAVEKLSHNGERVRAMTSLPEKIKYKTLLKITKEGIENVR